MNCIFRAAKKKLLLLAILAITQFLTPAYSQMRQVYLDATPDNVIRKISFYSASEGYVAFNDWIGFTSDSGKTFSKKYITQLNVDFGLNNVNLTFGFWIEGVKAFNKDTLVAYGHYGFVPAILRSTNGGNNFTLVFHNSYSSTVVKSGITDMVFPQGNKTGFAVDADRVLKTTDGGLSWLRVKLDPDSYFTNLEAVDNNIIFAFNPNKGKIISTFNGGNSDFSWARPSLPAGDVSYIHFRTGSVGWVNMYNNNKHYIYKTTNRVTWTLMNDPDAIPFSSYKMKFVNDSIGYALGFIIGDTSSFGQNTVFKTSDEGRTWHPLPRDNNFSYLGYVHNDLHFWNSSQFWAGGGHGFLEMTNNAGGTPLPKAYFKFDTTGTVPGGNVNLVNFSKPGYQYKWYLNGVFISDSYQASYQHVFTRNRDTVKLVLTNGIVTDSVTKYQNFVVPPIPTITSFVPASGSVGTMVTIHGINFSDVTRVSFGGVTASSFSIVSPTMIRAIVGNGSTGDIGLTSIYGTFNYPGFTYFAPPSSPPPVLSSFAPASGPIGTTVTITGNNFNTDLLNNIVYFGATKATVSSASATQIVCSVPAGASFVPVSVLNKSNGLTGYSDKPFNVVFADSSNFTVNSFVVPVASFSYSGNYPRFVDGVDLDGDGKPDFVYWVQRSGPDSLYIHRNTSSGGNFSFAPKVKIQIETGNGSGRFSLKDLDGDGKPDLACATNQGFILIYLNTSTPGNISFSPAMTVPIGGATFEIAIDDLDYDGKPDLVVAGGGLSIIRNTSSPGNLSFAESIYYQPSVVSVAVGDLDGDNKKDVVSFSGNTFSYFKNLSIPGTIVMSAKSDISVTSQAGFTGRNTFVEDFDGDNKQDVLVLNDYGWHLFHNSSSNGNISFDPEISYHIYGYAQGLTIANLSGDIKPDLLMGNSTSPYMYIFRNTSVSGNINTNPVVAISAGNSPSYTNAADFNLDGKADIVFSAGYHVSILKNSLGDKIPISLCSGGNGAIDSDLQGASFQWQQKKGSVFVNIDDNNIFSGTKTSKLTLSNIPLALRETLFRCVVDSNLFSSIYILKLTYVSPPEVSITASASSICYGTNVTFTATTVGGGVGPSYIWQVNGVSLTDIYNGSATFKRSNLNQNDQVRVIVVKWHDCAIIRDTSNIITMAVTGGQPSVSISSTASSNCAGIPLTFTATPVNGGSAMYQWQVNGVNVGTNSDIFTSSTLKNNDQVKVIMTPNGTCLAPAPVSSNTIQINVASSTPPAVTISSSSASVCKGSNVSFLATPTNGGSSPSYQWQVNGVNAGINSNTFITNSLNNNDEVKVIMTSNATCISTNVATSNTIKLNVNDALVPSLNIVASSTTICAGSIATFTATPLNGGSSPSYQWQVNGVNAGTNNNTFSTSALKNNDEVKVIMTSNAQCIANSTATSNIIIMTVIPTPVATISIAASTTTICAGSNVTFTASPVNGGSSPSYQWQVNGSTVGTNSNTFSTSSLKNHDEINVIMTSNDQCTTVTTSNSIVMTVNSIVIPSVSIAASSASICAGKSVTFTATPVNGGNSPSYQWQVNGSNVGTNSNTFISSSLKNNDEVKTILTSNASCATTNLATSNSIRISIANEVIPSVSIGASSTTVCKGSAVTFTATAINGGISPSYQWKVNGVNAGNNSNVFTTSSLSNNDEVKVVMTSNASCITNSAATSNGIVMTINDNMAPSVSIASSAVTICQGAAVTFIATPINGGSSPSYQWKVNDMNVGSNNKTYSSSTFVNGDVVSLVLTSNSPCAIPVLVKSNEIILSVNAVSANPGITISGPTTVVEGQAVLVSSVISNAGTTPLYEWQDSTDNHGWQTIAGATGGTISYIPTLTGNKIRCMLTSSANCIDQSTTMSNELVFTVTKVTAIDPVPASRYNIRLYPNPVKSRFIVDTLKISDRWESVEISSIDGKQKLLTKNILNQTSISLDVSRLSAGMYLLILRGKSGESAFLKFIKE